MLSIKRVATNKYEKEFKLMLKRGKNPRKLLEVVNLLINNANNDIEDHLLLPKKYYLYKLSGNYNNYWECHIEVDWLLIYYLDNEVLGLERTGTHANLF